MRDRTPYTNEELIEMADQVEEFCPRRAATYRELAGLRTRLDAPIIPGEAIGDMINLGAGFVVIDEHGARRLPPQKVSLLPGENDYDQD